MTMKLTSKVQIPKEVFEKIMYWVDKCDEEISGFGTVIFDKKEKIFTVNEVFLLEQEVGSAHTDIDATALSKLMYHVHKNKLKGELKFWWHSHVNMSVFWSSTDTETIKQLGSNGWIVATVFNKKEEMRTAICLNVDIPMLGSFPHIIDEVETEISNFYDADLTKAWDKELAEKVNTKSYRHWDRPAHLGPSPVQQKSEQALLGYTPTNWETIRSEARAIGMDPVKYANILDCGTQAEIDQLLYKLDIAETEGKLHYSERSTY